MRIASDAGGKFGRTDRVSLVKVQSSPLPPRLVSNFPSPPKCNITFKYMQLIYIYFTLFALMKSIPFNVVSTDMSHAVNPDERKKKSRQRSDHRDRLRSIHGTSCCWHSCLPVSFPRRVIVDHVTDTPKFVKKNERVNACTCLETFYLSIPPSQFRSHKSVLD